jgi:uncharacterized repeat protein (TIGR04076 family)
MAKVKITVIKKVNSKDLYGDKPPAESTEESECPLVELGQEFLIDDLTKYPPGLCAWAFSNIYQDIVHLFLGGDFPWVKEKGTAISCCTDGLRPVIFKLERIED